MKELYTCLISCIPLQAAPLESRCEQLVSTGTSYIVQYSSAWNKKEVHITRSNFPKVDSVIIMEQDGLKIYVNGSLYQKQPKHARSILENGCDQKIRQLNEISEEIFER